MEQTTIRGADGRVICESCAVARGPLSRMRGLLGRASLPSGEGILLRPAGSVHTFFMRFTIDVVFLDRDLRVVHVAEHLRPWHTARGKGAKAVLELRAGEAMRRSIRVGDTLALGATG